MTSTQELRRPQEEEETPPGYYDVRLPGASAACLRLKTLSNVFIPTGTSLLLIEAARELIRSPISVLDLGCGCGMTGLTLATLGHCAQPLFASDVSLPAVELIRENARHLGITCVAKVGSVFEPWRGQAFDCIVNDISGISEELAAISPWFPEGVPCGAGRDGTRWILHVLEQAAGYLNPGGVLLFPLLSLSAEQKILHAASLEFTHVKMVAERYWPLPESMAQQPMLIARLAEEGLIHCVRKFGAYVWRTRIYGAWNGALSEWRNGR